MGRFTRNVKKRILSGKALHSVRLPHWAGSPSAELSAKLETDDPDRLGKSSEPEISQGGLGPSRVDGRGWYAGFRSGERWPG